MRELWDDLQIVDDAAHLAFIKNKPQVAAALAAFADDEIRGVKGATPGTERSLKEIELEALLAAPEGSGDDVPVDQNFHARRLPDSVWRRSERSAGIESVIQLHRPREVLALAGFTRFEAVTPDIHGEYDESDVERAALALEPGSFPAVENRGEGLFLRLRGDAVDAWLRRPAVRERLDALERGHARWGAEAEARPAVPGRPLRSAAHAVALADPVAGDALRLSGQLAPRARLRRGRPLRAASLSNALRRQLASALHRGAEGQQRQPRQTAVPIPHLPERSSAVNGIDGAAKGRAAEPPEPNAAPRPAL